MTVRAMAIGGVADGRTVEIDPGERAFYTFPVMESLPVGDWTPDVDYEPMKVEHYRTERFMADNVEFWFLVPIKWDIATAMCKLVEGYRPLLPRKK